MMTHVFFVSSMYMTTHDSITSALPTLKTFARVMAPYVPGYTWFEELWYLCVLRIVFLKEVYLNMYLVAYDDLFY